ncbi:MAG TPA: hypothetical protein VGZ93_11945 [Candidatus Methylacidiphilales bacterium]|jgi:hypothetical protein|nr:hypothetical protein [Candidatus Methylacidiphilales bacterium]
MPPETPKPNTNEIEHHQLALLQELRDSYETRLSKLEARFQSLEQALPIIHQLPNKVESEQLMTALDSFKAQLDIFASLPGVSQRDS